MSAVFWWELSGSGAASYWSSTLEHHLTDPGARRLQEVRPIRTTIRCTSSTLSPE